MKKNSFNTLSRVATMNVFILHKRFIKVNILITGFLLSCYTLLIAQPGVETGIYPGFADTIIIASEPNYPPYCIVDENGNATGFSVDLFNAAANATGLNVIIKLGVWNQIKQDLAEGKIDALPLVGRTPEREELFDFTMPYLSLHGAVFARK
ncbi:MAG: transporter substrate-binding domain-containing protein, partial [Prolixibacteraceae bacterium]|nr:transporter substrate-binding domain-containing protein [Prolixibacteraceae bacterium]